MLMEKIVGDRRRWRQDTARVDVVTSRIEDLAGLFEQAADGTPVRAAVGEAPVEIERGNAMERERLVKAIERADAQVAGTRS